MRALVLVGVIGSGKTTLAESLPAHRIDFDHEWHVEAQQAHGAPHDAVCAMAERARAAGGDVVLDGWWTWEPEWWLTDDDDTLQHFSDLVPHEVRVCHLAMRTGDALTAFQRKHGTGQYQGSILDDVDAYAESLPARQDYLAWKVAQWAR